MAQGVSEAAHLTYCGRELRRHDHDRYLTCLFAPAERRDDLFALYCFNLEVARTAEVVSEEMLGRIRLQWWREAIDGIYEGRPRQHYVAEPLAQAVQRHGLTRGRFADLIDVRERDLETEPPDDLAALEDYAEASSAGLVLLALEVLGAGRDEAAVAAGRGVGLAWALTGLMRAVPVHARQKRLYLPVELCREYDLKFGDLFELRSSTALTQVVAQVATRAGEHLSAARALRSRVPRRALSALLPATLATHYLRTLRRCGYDPFHPAVQGQSGTRAWRLLLASLTGRF